MISDITKANILIAIVEGQSVADAAKSYGLSYAQARGALPRFCRHLKLRWDIEDIRANPKKYIDAAMAIVSSPKNALRRVLRDDLVIQLKLRSPDELTPQYVSNITAEALLLHGVSETGLVEVQEWLLANGLSCKRKLPEAVEHMRVVKKAITLLDAFGLDVSQPKAQLQAIDE